MICNYATARRNLIAMGVSQRIGFVPTAVGGTSIPNWLPPNGGEWNNMVNATMAAMAAAGPSAVLRGMLWVQVGGGSRNLRDAGWDPHIPHHVQGESDALDFWSAYNYYTNLQNFVLAVRQVFQPYNPQVRFHLSLSSSFSLKQH